MKTELTGVPRTALFTLRARAEEHAKEVPRFEDPWASEWFAALGWDPALDRFYSRWIQAKSAVRAAQIDAVVRSLIDKQDPSAVVELGCGLSSRRQRLQEDLRAAWYDVDLPPIMKVRAELGASEDATALATSALDPDWLEAVRARPDFAPERTVLIAEGLLYYLPRAEVNAAFAAWRAALPGAGVVFDVIGQLDVQAARGYSARIDAPIEWAVEPPFEAAMHDLGLDEISGLGPDDLLQDALHHVGPALRPLLAGFSKLRFLRNRRSGLMAGRLRPV